MEIPDEDLPGTEQRTLDAWIALLQAHALVIESVERDLMREVGIPLPWHEVLVRLARADHGEWPGMRMQELARSVLLSKSGLTRLADRMERRGLIERSACPTDRRGTVAQITELGRTTLRRAAPVFTRSLQHHLARHASAGDLQALSAILGRVVRRSGAYPEECTGDDLRGEAQPRAEERAQAGTG